MIVYRYIPYQPEDNEKWTIDQLMSLLSDLVMRYDIQLEEALRELLQKGLPVNLFLKQGGIEDLLQEFIEKLQNQIQEIQEKFDLRPALEETEKDLQNHYSETYHKFQKDNDFLSQLQKAIKERSYDQLQQMKWSLLNVSSRESKELYKELSQLLRDIEDYNYILEGMKKYRFRGNQGIKRNEAIKLLHQLEELEKFIEQLKQSLKDGDIYNFDLEKLKRFLGPESYQEFLQRREEIYKHITELLEKQGRIVKNEEGKYEFSPQSLRRIGRKSLEEIFKHMKSDSLGGSFYSKEEGDNEQVIPSTREYQMGDNFTNVDFPNSILNALIRTRQPKPTFLDLEVFKSRGMAKSSIVILLDMSGSMFRVDRFFYAKKVILALESLIREEFKEDTLHIVGFGTFAKTYTISQVPKLQPYPVTLFDPYIRLRFDLSKRKPGDYRGIPEYFTNLQKGLALSRRLLSNKQTKNKQIILITDGVPTAHFEGSVLHINYPPSPADFDFAIKEAIACREEGIIINTFLLTNEWNLHFFEGRSFIYDFARSSKGRIFYPHPKDLGKLVLADFIEEKKKLIS
ncbi:MAG: hypothetical protein NZ853_08210 [Leptospiraceae bacterium]|nr:hypothetical protein [Leptospiraceae bacterium]MDW7976842.1 hypothetical protein [Leptospiraceae bacterium]